MIESKPQTIESVCKELGAVQAFIQLVPKVQNLIAQCGAVDNRVRKYLPGYAMERKEAQRIVTAMGGKVVTGEYGKIKGANLLVCGTIIGGAQKTQKMDQASQRNAATMTAEQFFGIIAGK